MLREPPRSVIAWSDQRLRAGYVAILFAAVVGLMLLPRVVINSDEYLYAGQARILLHGRLLPVDGDPLPGAHDPLHSIESGRYPPGWPLVLALGAIWSFRGMFVIALAVHLLGGAAVARMMVRRGLPSLLAAAWLFHPLFWSFSRTLMADVPAAAVLLLAMDAWENKRTKTAAAAIGYSVLIRVASLAPAAGFLLAVGNQVRRKWRPLSMLALGAACGLAALLVVNALKYGHPLRTPYSANQSQLTTQMVGQNALFYVLGALLIPPFPLLCLVLRPRSCDRWVLVALPVVLFFLFYGYRDESPRLLESFLGGQRYMLPAQAALLIATAGVWSRIPLVRLAPVLLGAGVLAAVVQFFAVRHLVDRYEPAAMAVAACRPTSVSYNQYASRVALSTNGSSYRLVDDGEPSALPDVVVISLRQLTNRFSTPVTYEVPEWLRRFANRCRGFGEFRLFDLAGRCPPMGDACSFSESR